MTKRKPSQFDSACQPEQAKCLLKRRDHMVNTVSAGEKLTNCTAFKIAEMMKEDCLICDEGNPEGNEKDPEASLRSNDHSSADVPCILFKDPNSYGKAEVISKCRDADVAKHSHMTSEIDSSPSEKSMFNKKYSRRVKEKSSKTETANCPSLPVAQESTNGNTASLSSITKVGSLGSPWKISDGTFIEDCSLLPVVRENDILAEDACIYSDKSDILDVPNSELKAVKSKSKGYEETENNGKDMVLGFSQHCLELDRNNPSTTNLPSNVGVSTWLGKENVETTIESNPVMNVDSQVGCMVESKDATSPCESSTLCVASSNSYVAIDPSIQNEVGKQLEQDKTIIFSSCSTGHLPDDALDSVSQVTQRDVVDDFHESSASMEAQRSREIMMKPALHDRFCDDTSAINNGEVKSHDVSLASDILQEGNQKALSTCCRELPSPIRGVMHDTGSSDKLNKKNSHLDAYKDELSFSFPVTEEVNTDESYDDHSKKTRLCHEGIGSVDLVLIQKNDTVHSAPPCIQEEAINGPNKNELDSVLVSDTAEKAPSSDLISTQEEELKTGVLEPGRSLSRPPKKKLLVLDLNGLLADIISDFRSAHKAQKKVGGKSIFKRPFCDEFLDFCFKMFDVGVWSSRKGYNVDGVVNFLMGDNKHKLLFCWDQSKCTFTGFKTLENRHKPLVLKELKKLWDKEENDLPWEKGEYSPSNTLLVDDSPYKALCNPPHTAIFPEPYCFDDEKDNSLGPGGKLRVYLEGLAACNNVQQYVCEHPFGQQAISTNDASWSFYLQIINNVEKSLARAQ